MLASLGELLQGIETGKSFKCEERPPMHDEVGVVKVSAVTWGRYQELESKTCTDPERVNPALFIAAGDFLFSRANTIDLVGACVIAENVSRQIMLSDKILRFRFTDESHKYWVLNLLRSKAGRKQIEALSSSNQDSMRNIGQERIQQIEIPLPPRAEQTRIVGKLEELLSDLDAGVAELKAARKKLTQYRQSLLKAAVEGELTADWRQHNRPAETGAQLLERILAERRARWEARQLANFEAQGKTPPKDWRKKYPEPVQPDTAELPELPEGWVWASVDQLSPGDLANGRSVPTADHGAKVLRLTAVRDGQIDLTEFKCGAWTDDDARPFSVSEGDLLVVRGNGSLSLVGRMGLVPAVTEPIAYPDTLIRLRVLESVVTPGWISTIWGSALVRRHLERRARTSAGIYKISQPDIVSVAIPVPPIGEQITALQLLDVVRQEIFSSAIAINHAFHQSTTQRQNILRAAFSGQLVPQDPTDEPASKLLERIRAERAAVKGPRGRNKITRD
ncbi:restriction endonuclease subunit S [Zoogloea ramigera]|uniref:restriction endonuclease subunit S n=1 Tax=Zoogloea ramigera TaxID=350 RepID=UPI003FA1E13E